MVSVTFQGVEYAIETDFERRSVRIYVDGEYAGRGVWSGYRIEDCAAVLPEGAYDALDAAIASAIAHGPKVAVEEWNLLHEDRDVEVRWCLIDDDRASRLVRAAGQECGLWWSRPGPSFYALRVDSRSAGRVEAECAGTPKLPAEVERGDDYSIFILSPGRFPLRIAGPGWAAIVTREEVAGTRSSSLRFKRSEIETPRRSRGHFRNPLTPGSW